MGLIAAAPAVPLFLAALAGAVVAVELRPGTAHLATAGLVLAGAHMFVFARRRAWHRFVAAGWVAVVVASVTAYHLGTEALWRSALSEGDGVWYGRLHTETALDGTVGRTLHLDPWDGRGRPRLRLAESAFHEPVDEEVWSAIPDGARVSVTGTLRHPSASGNPGEFNYAMYLYRQNVAATVYVHDVALADDSVPLRYRLGQRIDGLFARLRNAMARRIAVATSPSAGPVLIAMTTGARELLSEATENAFRRTGTSHLLAVSGLHVGMIGALALLLARAARLDGWRRDLVVACIVWGFVLLTGARPSSLRAGLTASLGLAAYRLRRAVEPLQLWALSGLVLLIVKPLLAYDAGFQLSYAATGSILLWLRALQSRLPRGPTGRVALACAISLAAQAGTAPLIAFYFHEVSLVGVVVNWVAVPLAAPVLYLTVLGMLISVLSEPVGALFIALAGKVVDIGLRSLTAVAEHPWAAAEVAAPKLPTAWGLALFLSGLPLTLQRGEASTAVVGRRLLAAAMALLCGATWLPFFRSSLGIVEITFIDVGQGDAILIRTPRGRTVLVDGGGSPRRAVDDYFDVGARRLVPYLQHIGVRRVDIVVNTHPDEDHLQGLLAVLRTRQVGLVLDSGQAANTWTYREYVDLLAGHGLLYHEARRGHTIVLDDDIVLTVLGPRGDGAATSLNNGSVVLRLDTPHGSVLLPGDLERSGQQELLWGAENVRLDATVIKVPHHGSARDVDWRFIDAVQPQVAVFQVGRNSFGHPSREALSAYAERGARIYRNDAHGAVTVYLTPWGVRVHTHRRHGPPGQLSVIEVERTDSRRT